MGGKVSAGTSSAGQKCGSSASLERSHRIAVLIVPPEIASLRVSRFCSALLLAPESDLPDRQFRYSRMVLLGHRGHSPCDKGCAEISTARAGTCQSST